MALLALVPPLFSMVMNPRLLDEKKTKGGFYPPFLFPKLIFS
jgi:hypothetical protein